MALGDSKYGISVKFNYADEGKTKTLNYVNYNATSIAGGSSAYGMDDAAVLSLGYKIAELAVSGAATGVYLTRENEVESD